jgi:hypothetical protein
MANVFLIISKPQQDIAQLRVKCSVREGAEDVNNVRDRQFAGPRELESALRIAGVTEDESHAPLQVFHTGLPTFIPVNEDIAQKLGVLE